MGEDLDPEMYRRALRVAQLGPDLMILPQVCVCVCVCVCPKRRLVTRYSKDITVHGSDF
jgi:hypothetical protein